MAITARELLQYAESLAQASEEVRVRNAAGRAFYAAHHSCRPVYDRLNAGRRTREGTHQRLIRLFTGFVGGPNEEVSRKVRAVGAMYRHARELRSKADYDIAIDFTRDECKVLLETAKTIIEWMTELEDMNFG